MKIGLVTGEYPPMEGGVGDFTHELARALTELQHEVHVITRTGCGTSRATSSDSTSEINDAEIPQADKKGEGPVVHAIIPRWDWRSSLSVMRLVRSLQLEILNIQYQAAAYDLHPAINFYPFSIPLTNRWQSRVEALNPRRRKPERIKGLSDSPTFVVTFHDLKVPYLFPKAGDLRDRVVTFLARRADAAITTNLLDELTLSARSVGQVERIPIGSNITPVLPGGYDRDAWRAKWQVKPQDFLLGHFGFFNARKGIETLVRSLAYLEPSYHLLFIGGTVGSSDATNKAYVERIEALTTQLRLTDRVHYTGYAPETEVSAAFSALDLCVLPYLDGASFHHGTLMAALTHGQPIVSTLPRVRVPELVHGKNIWLIRPGDVEMLVDAVNTLSTEPHRRQRLAQGAKALSKQFSWECIAAKTANLFESLRRES
jgi:glycosyltransferase involved in cell wall biosynthesis